MRCQRVGGRGGEGCRSAGDIKREEEEGGGGGRRGGAGETKRVETFTGSLKGLDLGFRV